MVSTGKMTEKEWNVDTVRKNSEDGGKRHWWQNEVTVQEDFDCIDSEYG